VILWDLAKPFVVRIACAAALSAVAPLLAWNGFVRQVNAALGDVLMRLRGQVASHSAAQIVLLAIDDQTAARYGPLPLRRSLLAAGLNRLAAAGPKILALDLLISEPGIPADDEALAAALRRFPRRVIGAAIAGSAGSRPAWILPMLLLRAGAAIGHTHAAPDADGVVRSILLAKEADAQRYWALGLEAAALALGTPRPLEAPGYLGVGTIRIPATQAEDRAMTIDYAGPEGVFARVPFSALLDGSAPPEMFRNRIVILGSTALGFGDRLFTPLSSEIGMSGIEIHANVIRTILDRAFLVPLDAPEELLLYAAVIALCVAGAGLLREIWLAPALTAVAALLPFASWFALRAGSVWPLGSLFAVFIASAAVAVAGEYGFVSAALRRSEDRRKEHAFRVQAVAHEIKTPLTAIQGSSEMISEGGLPDEKRAEMAGLIYKESKRLTSLLQAFLNVERMAAGAIAIEKRAVDARTLSAEVVERAQLYAGRKAIRIVSTVPQLKLRADPELLSFAIYNLLTNAVKYSPRETQIVVSAADRDDSATIIVADQGYGIAPRDQPRVFEKFYRLKRDEHGPEAGTGIGLALVKEIMEQHGGSVVVESRPGAGSRFTLVLPK
jgi:signal transduction histidine kinase